MDCPYCESNNHRNIHSVVRHVLMTHVPAQYRLTRVLFRTAPKVTPEYEVTVSARCVCGETVESGQLSFLEKLSSHLEGCGSFPELKALLDA